MTVQVKKIPAIQPHKLKAEMCRRSLAFFVKEFWDIIIPDDLEWNWHMDTLCDEIQYVYTLVAEREGKEYDVIINIPPGTTKSTIATVMAPAWSWTIDSTMRHITGSYSDSLATEHAVKSRDIIRSDKYQLYFPEITVKKDEDNKTNYKTNQGGQRYVTSTGGSVTGVHAHVITIDDPLNPKQSTSAVQLQEACSWFDKTLSTRKVDKKISVTILIMQRLAVGDPTGHLLDKPDKKIRHICLPATVSDAVSPPELKSQYVDGYLDPNRLGPKVLSELKTDLGSAGYAGQIDQVPAPEGGLIWQKWFIEIPDDEFPSLSKMHSLGNDWDLAYTKEDVNAASAYVQGGKINNDIYITGLGWKWLEFPKLINWMKTIPHTHFIEAKASGKSAKQALVHEGINAVEVKVKGGADKIARARMATPPVEAGRVYIKKSLADRLYNDSKQGILFFPKGKHKDLADALAQCILRLDTKPLAVSSIDDNWLDKL